MGRCQWFWTRPSGVRGFIGHTCGVKVQRERFLGLTGLTAGGFLGLTGPLAPRVADCRSAAMLIKLALRDWLYESYSLIRITVISHLRWLFPPLWCLTAPKGECISDARRAVGLFSHGRKPGCEGFFIRGRLL